MDNRFIDLPQIPIDQIMLINAGWPAFKQKHPDAVNTTIGVLIDPDTSAPWQPRSVIKARQQALEEINSNFEYGYQPQVGNLEFLDKAADFAFGKDLHKQIASDLLACQTLGGTGALSFTKEVLASFIKPDGVGNIPLVLDPGWPNHPAIFTNPFAITTYDHVDPQTGEYNHSAAVKTIGNAPRNTVLLLQTCGYNDDGADRSQKQWDEIFDIATELNATIVLDSAYIGLADGLQTDRYPLEESIRRGLLTFICLSTSKNMGLYSERVGALFVTNAKKYIGDKQYQNLRGLIARAVRRTISSPPLLAAKAAGIALVSSEYLEELEQARKKLLTTRNLFAESVLSELPHIAHGKGLFTKIFPEGFNNAQQALLEREGILALPNSRLNLGALQAAQVEKVSSVIISALKLKSH
ncbi:MAG: aminotransferase class I/II-fold pyridoxal phosphate-dependent enzyme [Patescibacteria group bacterium]